MGHRLVPTIEPLPPGNSSTAELRADMNRSVGERVREAIELSDFATALAQRTAGRRR